MNLYVVDVVVTFCIFFISVSSNVVVSAFIVVKSLDFLVAVVTDAVAFRVVVLQLLLLALFLLSLS